MINLYCLECNKKLKNIQISNKRCICDSSRDISQDISIQKDISIKIKNLFTKRKNIEKLKKFEYGKTIIPLSKSTFSSEEIIESMQSHLSTYLTMGTKVGLFEKSFSKYLKTKSSIAVTSGSTANSLALAILSSPMVKNHLKPGDEIITTPLTFATSVYPIEDIGCKPVFVDIDLETLNIDEKKIEKSITNKTRAIMPVHLLGIPCKIDKIKAIAKKHNLFLIEDAADSSGAEYKGKKLGSFGDISTFSFFYTHIMTTIEGGMVSTNNKYFAELAKSKRAFGWIRDLKDKKKIEKKYKNIDPRFLFITKGFNFKPTEVQGAFGMHQIKKLDSLIDARRKNANYWAKRLAKFEEYLIIIKEMKNTKYAWYGYPIIVKEEAPFSKNQLIKFLNSKGVQTRPILSGNIDQQPVAKELNYRKQKLTNATLVNDNGFFIGNHHGIHKIAREAIAGYFEDFFNQYEVR
ncbi:DegT/DnrJ/EryC1/StrS family aminotransferase [Candidatus Pelagibacter sp. Uisw_136]|uniref:DegT/DnrJ/EryC1/StrS family aminotransferase n=1 Tax=Candidatus Pelagibacter sp. Uisw_136 TaxID=3230991 RepID=UPI0039EB8168